MNLIKCLLVLVVLGATISCSEETVSPDTTAPISIRDLSVHTSSEGLLLRWTAPGDDLLTGQATGYDIRYTIGSIASKWDSAPTIAFPSRSPSPAGSADSVLVPDLQPGTWQIAMKSADEVPNWSALSNVVTVTVAVPDTIPPAPITDLTVISVTQGTVTLQWTASGGDGVIGRAASYDLRYTIGAMTPETWPEATPAAGLSAPMAAGATESFTVSGLEVEQNYEFALKAADESQNWSGLSNVATASISSLAPFQITFNNSFFGAGWPNWSPEGHSIVCAMGLETILRRQIFVVPASGGNSVQYTSFPEGATQPSWSPDGSQFAFVKMEPRGISTVSLLAVMGSTPDASSQVLADYGTQGSVRTSEVVARRNGDRVSRFHIRPAESHHLRHLHHPVHWGNAHTTGRWRTHQRPRLVSGWDADRVRL